LIDVAGGVNIFRDAVGAYPSVSIEEVLARNPEVIIDIGDVADESAVTETHTREVAALWQRLSTLAAVKQRRIHLVNPDIFLTPGPRVVNAAEVLAGILH